MRYAYIYMVLMICFYSSVQAQHILDESRDLFTLEVQVLNDFFDRFNGKPRPKVKQLLQELNPEANLGRKDFLLGVLDQSSPSFSMDNINDFIDEVEAKTEQLDFYDDYWYAEVDCSIKHKGKNYPIKFWMQNQGNPTSGSEWKILNFETSVDVGSYCEPLPEICEPNNILSPTSHEVGFAGLVRAFRDKRNLPNYFVPSGPKDKINDFIWAIKDGAVAFVSVNNIQYHFLQIENWKFKVGYISRKSRNSGWLINELTRSTKKEKDETIKNILKQ